MNERDKLMSRISRAGARIDPGLTDRDVERLIRKARGRRLQRRLRRRALVVGVAVLGGSALIVTSIAHRGSPGSGPSGTVAVVHDKGPIVAGAAEAHLVRLADGSTVTLAGTDTSLVVREDSRTRVSIDLTRGRGLFDVVPNHDRAFEVRAGEVNIVVVGTVFSVERVADRVGIAVDRGVVRVAWDGGTRDLTVGQSGWFPPLQFQADASVVPPSMRQAAAPSSLRWNADNAFAPSRSSAAITRSPSVADKLLRAADAERAAGRPQDGARLLRRLLREHRDDPRAPLGAMTLGRLLMIEIGKPREAAAAFAEARRLAPHGPFAEDALAREVEAWSKAGDAVAAAKRARLYLDHYPDGHRTDTVKAFGGVE